MIKYLLTILILICTTANHAQPGKELPKLAEQVKSLEKRNAGMQKRIDSLATVINFSMSQMLQPPDSAHVVNSQKPVKGGAPDHHSIFRTIHYWLIGLSFLGLINLIGFLIIRNQGQRTSNRLEQELGRKMQEMQDMTFQLDVKLVEILHTQWALIKKEDKMVGPALQEPDHKLALRVGEEIHRMRKRLEHMPREIKGMSALTNSLERLEEEFNNSGYEMDDLLGKKYIDGMKVEARFVDNPDLPKGEEIITDVLRPAIKYKGILIQVAKVEVGKS